MRICMLVRNACVRDARVLREAGTLAAAGHDVTIIATLEPGVPRVEQRDGFTIRRVEPVAPWISTLARRPAIPPSVDVAADPMATQQKPALKRRPSALIAIRDVLVTRQFTRAARATPADVYHANDANTLAAAVRAARKNRARLVYDAHELYWELSGLSPFEKKRWFRLEHRLIGKADRIITVSDSLADELVKRHNVPRPLVLINCPERPQTQHDATASPLRALKRDGEMLVLYAGGISANRGLEGLVDAARAARGWRLVMMGWGRLHDELKARAPEVTFVDPVPPEQLVAAAAGADVGVIPYVPVGLNNALSLPNKLFEYVHAGLAVAASDLVELRRFITATGAGVLFPPGDAGAITEAFDALAADPARLRAMRAAADKAAPTCDWTVEKRKLTDLYAALV